MRKYSSEDNRRFISNAMYARKDGAGHLFVMYFLFERLKKRKNKAMLTLRKYIEFKGERATAMDIYQKCKHIVIPYEEKDVSVLYVKCIKEAKRLKQGKIYRVCTVYGAYDEYLIFSSEYRCDAYSAELFEVQDVIEVEYTGYEDEDGKLQITEGFHPGERYKVLSYNGMYKCENGLKCDWTECKPKEFVKAKPKKPKPFKNKEEALRCVGNAWEFGAVRDLSEHLHPNCKFDFLSGEKRLETKKDITQFMQDFSEYSLENDYFVFCKTETVEKDPASDSIRENERCVMIYDEAGECTAVFITLSKDRRYITEITLTDGGYKFRSES